jgi:hypothetical protein
MTKIILHDVVLSCSLFWGTLNITVDREDRFTFISTKSHIQSHQMDAMPSVPQAFKMNFAGTGTQSCSPIPMGLHSVAIGNYSLVSYTFQQSKHESRTTLYIPQETIVLAGRHITPPLNSNAKLNASLEQVIDSETLLTLRSFTHLTKMDDTVKKLIA